MNLRYLNEIAEALAEEHVALMVGAGFSKNAEKIATTDKYFLNWNELSDRFYETIYDDLNSEKKDYISSLRLAQEVEISVGRPKLEKIIKDAVPDLEYAPSELYLKLMELPWKDVFTTNYDTLLERAADLVVNRRYEVVVQQEDLVNSSAPRIIKLHGSFPSHRPFVITEEDYRVYPIKCAAMVNTVQQALLENIFCMIGFSCEDPNFVKWIGWIRDNLGKGASQRMYMISISSVPEAKKRLLFDQNIVVVDLEELWKKKSVGERLVAFLDILKSKIEQKTKKDSWDINISDERLKSNDAVQLAILLKEFNESYPGWIFLPWKMKAKAKYVLDMLDRNDVFTTDFDTNQVNFIYEYVKFLDIVGRPILLQQIECFTEKIDSIVWENIDEKEVKSFKLKVQYIYIHLLRAYRELANWEEYDNCRKKIQAEILNYEERQFLYASDCYYCLYRFRAIDFVEKLEKWKLAKGDVYWPLIKASLYAIIGEFSKADTLLSENLKVVRRQLVKTDRAEYLESIEESIVSLINFIRQGEYKKELEKSSNLRSISWWEENRQYCLNLKGEQKIQSIHSSITEFNLSTSHIAHYGVDNTEVFYAMEYLRFLEQTGHPFRLRHVTNTLGLKGTVDRLAVYYPHWCLMQLLMAQENKHLDCLFGRSKLASMPIDSVDELAIEYIEILRVIMKNVNSKNYFYAKTIYEYSASVLPEILARLCSKCSISVLDSVLDIILELCLSDIRVNFKKINHVLKNIIKAYSSEQQMERIGKILAFPIEFDRINDYYDPLTYISVPKEKEQLEIELYNKTIFQLKDKIENTAEEIKEWAVHRLVILAQIVRLEENDREYLYSLLQNSSSLNDKYVLYRLDTERFKNYANEIYKDVLSEMKYDSNRGVFSESKVGYGRLIEVLENNNDVDVLELFSVMIELINTNVSWLEEEKITARERVSQCFRIAVSVLLLSKKIKKTFSEEEVEKTKEYFKALKQVYSNANILDAICSLLIGNEIDITPIKNEFWVCEDDMFSLLEDFYEMISVNELDIPSYREIEVFSEMLLEVAICKVINQSLDKKKITLNLIYALIQNGVLRQDMHKLFDAVFIKLIEDTRFVIDEDEKKARQKVICRNIICAITKKLNDLGIVLECVNQWNSITKNPDEFWEIKNMTFDLHVN